MAVESRELIPFELTRIQPGVIVKFPITPEQIAKRVLREQLETLTSTPERFDEFLAEQEWNPHQLRELLLLKSTQPGYKIESVSHVDSQTHESVDYLKVTAPNGGLHMFKAKDIDERKTFIDEVTEKTK